MNNLQTLENEIRSKLPHTMELSAGCEIVALRSKYTFLKKDGNIFYVLNSKKREIIFNNPTYHKIGHQITLSNVLEWLNLISGSTMYAIDCDGFFCIKSPIFNTWSDTNMPYWDLRKNLLREQSTELIDALTNLIEK